MEYPNDLLPHFNFKEIIIEHAEKVFLIRSTVSKDYLDEFSETIRNEHIALQSNHILNWSCNLYNQFNESHIPITILNKDFIKVWNFEDKVSALKYKVDFDTDFNKGHYFVNLELLIKNLKIPFNYREQNDLIATPFIKHVPTLCNFWHMEIMFKDAEGNIDRVENSKKADRVAKTLKNTIRQFCFLEKPSKFIKIEIKK